MIIYTPSIKMHYSRSILAKNTQKKAVNGIITIICVLMCSIQGSYAQQPQKISPTVEVERDFDSRIPNIHKSRLFTDIADTLSNFNLNFNYSIFDKPYRDLYEFSPLPSAQIQSKTERKYPYLMAKASMGFPANPRAELWFQPHLKGKSSLQFNTSFNGYYNKLPLVTFNNNFKTKKHNDLEAAANNNAFKIGGSYRYNWSGGELSIGIGFNTNYNTYYGFCPTSTLPEMIDDNSYMKDNFSHRYNQVGARFSINSTNAVSRGSKFNYKLNINYLNTTDKLPEGGRITMGVPDNFKLNENLIKVEGNFGPNFGKYNRVTIGFNSENVIYSNLQDYKYGLYEITPQYSFEKGRLKIKAGLKLSGRYKSKDYTDKYHNAVFAKADISMELAKRFLCIYAKVDGGNTLNSYSSLLSENRWISQLADLKAGSIPFIIKGGLRGSIYNKFSFNLFAQYTIHEGLLQYVPADEYILNFEQGSVMPVNTLPDSRLYAIYSNHREFTAGFALNWYSKSFRAGTSLEYSNYTNGKESTLTDGYKPYGYAPFKWYIHGTYNHKEKIFVGLSANIRGSAPVYASSYLLNTVNEADTATSLYDAKIKGFCNLSFNARYVIDSMFSVFITGENLFNAKIEYYPQYLENGISFSAGVLVKL